MSDNKTKTIRKKRNTNKLIGVYNRCIEILKYHPHTENAISVIMEKIKLAKQ